MFYNFHDRRSCQRFQMRITWPVVLPATPLMSLLSDWTVLCQNGMSRHIEFLKTRMLIKQYNRINKKIAYLKNWIKWNIIHFWRVKVYSLPMIPRFYDTAVFILSVAMHCSATRRFFYLYIHKHNSHIYRNVWSFCPNVLNFCKYTYFYLFLRNSGHFYFTLIPCFVKCPIIKP